MYNPIGDPNVVHLKFRFVGGGMSFVRCSWDGSLQPIVCIAISVMSFPEIRRSFVQLNRLIVFFGCFLT